MGAVATGVRATRQVAADVTGCAECPNYVKTVLFELCKAKESEYRSHVGDVSLPELHTIQHMRDEFVGLCAPEMLLRPKK